MTRIELPTFDLSVVMEAVGKDLPKPIPREVEEQALKEKLKKMEAEYRHFLWLCKSEPLISHRPSTDADIVWHKHLIHSEQYVEDCFAYFGHYFHHRPKDFQDGSESSADCHTPRCGGGPGCSGPKHGSDNFTLNFFHV